jgi:DNA mismatch endonuclease (patch repair protein)
MDKMNPIQRSFCMRSVHSKSTKPELLVRKDLWRRGFRYRLNFSKLPGHPDLVLKKYRTCIFVNGCFWHGHGVSLDDKNELRNDKSCCRIPQTNRDFWVAKIRRNQERDIEEQKRLAEMGWHCITIWECELKPSKREQTLKSLAFTLNKIWLDDHSVVGKPYPKCEEDGMLMAAEKDEEE